MAGSWSLQELPHLNESNHSVESPCTSRYNCIAWAAGMDDRWWWPDSRGIGFWPKNVLREETISAFVQAFAAIGYVQCVDGLLENNFEKIAIYAKRDLGILVPTHAARQLPDGRWASKLGPLEDIYHLSSDSVNGPVYGEPFVYMKRPHIK